MAATMKANDGFMEVSYRKSKVAEKSNDKAAMRPSYASVTKVRESSASVTKVRESSPSVTKVRESPATVNPVPQARVYEAVGDATKLEHGKCTEEYIDLHMKMLRVTMMAHDFPADTIYVDDKEVKALEILNILDVKLDNLRMVVNLKGYDEPEYAIAKLDLHLKMYNLVAAKVNSVLKMDDKHMHMLVVVGQIKAPFTNSDGEYEYGEQTPVGQMVRAHLKHRGIRFKNYKTWTLLFIHPQPGMGAP